MFLLGIAFSLNVYIELKCQGIFFNITIHSEKHFLPNIKNKVCSFQKNQLQNNLRYLVFLFNFHVKVIYT